MNLLYNLGTSCLESFNNQTSLGMSYDIGSEKAKALIKLHMLICVIVHIIWHKIHFLMARNKFYFNLFVDSPYRDKFSDTKY